MKLKIIISFFLLLSCATFVNAQSSIKTTVTKSSTDATKVFVDISWDNEGEIRTCAFDLFYPKDLEYISVAASGKATELVYNEEYEQYLPTPTWQFSGTNYDQFVAISGNSLNDSKNIPEKQTDYKITRITFRGNGNYTTADFTFNNVSAAGKGGVRENVKFPIGNIGTNGLSSYSSSQDIEISGADAYYGQLNETDPDNICLELVPVTGAIKANEGVILKGTSGIVYGTSVNSAEAPNTNDLKASVNGVTVGSNVYVLSTKNNNTGFYHFSGTKIPAGKAYVELTTKSQAPIRIISSVTGIENFVSKDNIITNSVDLYGRKAQVGQKGFVIENGNKIIRL